MFGIKETPRILQRKGGQTQAINRYKKLLRGEFENHKAKLNQLKTKPLSLFLIAYLSKKHIQEYDVDNIPKHVINVLKEFIEDDNIIHRLIIEKKEVDIPTGENPNKYEQFLVCLSELDCKDILEDLL